MWCAIAMPPYGGFFMAVDPLQKHIFRGALKAIHIPPTQNNPDRHLTKSDRLHIGTQHLVLGQTQLRTLDAREP
jgi:hypothetical protein